MFLLMQEMQKFPFTPPREMEPMLCPSTVYPPPVYHSAGLFLQDFPWYLQPNITSEKQLLGIMCCFPTRKVATKLATSCPDSKYNLIQFWTKKGYGRRRTMQLWCV